MSVAKVLKLDEYRDRRHHRLKLTEALCQVDASRREMLRQLADIAAISGADRVATVWVDEYGPGLVHPFVVLDLLSDTPRRSFPIEPLRRAWEVGVPGAHDEVAGPGGTGASTFAIALGSDGARAWFVVADSISARPPLDDHARDGLMFRAGECSALALHRDLDEDPSTADEGRFAGWPILRDLEGREGEDSEARRIAQRFVAARLVRMLVDNDLVMSDERVLELVQAARRELAQDQAMEAKEKRLWVQLLEAFEARSMAELARLSTELGELAEARGHEHGARELYQCAFGLAAAVGEPYPAANAARCLGRLHRRRARREEAEGWYETNRAIAEVAGIDHLAALALTGLSSLTRERGNLPAARSKLDEALELALRSGHAATIVVLHREFKALELAAGNVDEALRHAWKAVAASATGEDRASSLASLAGALEGAEDYELAAETWSVVAETSDSAYLRVMALDALAYISAIQGDEDGFERHASRCDALQHETIHNAHVQILYYRGLSHRALGRLDDARTWLERAVSFAEQHGFNETLFKAEEALAGLATHEAVRAEPVPAAPQVVRDGVQAMRRELVGAAS